jgi:hypothetical protein
MGFMQKYKHCPSSPWITTREHEESRGAKKSGMEVLPGAGPAYSEKPMVKPKEISSNISSKKVSM